MKSHIEQYAEVEAMKKVDVLNEIQLAVDVCAANGLPGTAGLLLQVHDAVADAMKTLDDIGALSMARRHGGPVPMDLDELDRALGMAINMAHECIGRMGASA